jgi:hypothetical protein
MRTLLLALLGFVISSSAFAYDIDLRKGESTVGVSGTSSIQAKKAKYSGLDVIQIVLSNVPFNYLKTSDGRLLPVDAAASIQSFSFKTDSSGILNLDLEYGSARRGDLTPEPLVIHY